MRLINLFLLQVIYMSEHSVPTSMVIAAGGGYKIIGLAERGILAFAPYKDKNLFERAAREIWFRIGLPEKVWYTKEIANHNGITGIRVRDCLITVPFLKWLQQAYPDARIEYFYDNLVGNAKHVLPADVPEGIVKASFDPKDAEKYGMKWCSGEFSHLYLRPRLPIEYDVFYVGSDKGRGDYVMSLQQQFEKMGLKTKFIVAAASRFGRRKKYYSKPITYEEVLEYDCKSKALLNIVVPGQTGASNRDWEALYLKAKLITNNSRIKMLDFYKPENVFILGEDSMDRLVEFINSPLVPVEESVLQKHLL